MSSGSLPRAPGGQPSHPESFLGFEPSDIEQSIVARFSHQVSRGSARLAVSDGASRWSYGELDEVANRVANSLLEAHSEPAEVVALLMEQGAPCVAAILGTLKAGKVYASLDGSLPESQLASLVGATGARIVLATRRMGSLARHVAPPGVRVLEFEDLGSASGSGDPQRHLPPEAPATLFFTSGSTGLPKGVLDTHRNVLHNVMRYTNSLRIGSSDRLSLLQAPGFSGSVSNVFGSLLNGASVFPYDLESRGAGGVAEWLAREEITIYHSVPSLFRIVARGGGPFPSLRVVRLEGDQASRRDVDLFTQCCAPDCTLVNGLGATECGLVRQYVVDSSSAEGSGALPVGYPVPGMDVQIVDEELAPLPKGEVGEIAVRSRFLALGYWKDPEQTRRRFRSSDPTRDADPSTPRTYLTGDLGRMEEDGCLEVLGRKSLQPRIRGRFVDVGLVESVLLELEGLREVAVHATPDVHGELRVVAYAVPDDGCLPPIAQMRRVLAERVPDFMIPTAYVCLDALPLSSHGKLDREGLPEPGTERPETGTPFEPARSELERRLAAVWEDVLGVSPVGVHDDFLDLGGQSLSAVQLIEELEREFERRLPLASLLEHPTIRGQAEFLEGRAELADLPTRWGSIVELPGGRREPPLFFMPGSEGSLLGPRRLARALDADRACYGFAFRARPGGPAEEATLEEIAADFVEQARRIQPSGRYALCGYSWGAILAFEAARQIVASGGEVEFLGVFDEAAPISKSLAASGTAFIRQFLALGWRDRPSQVRAMLSRRLGRGGSALPSSQRPQGVDARTWLEQEWKSASRLAKLAQHRYRPVGSYPGRLTLFVGSGNRPSGPAPPDLGWSRLVSGGVEIVEIPGSHGLLLEEPHVASLAAELRRGLEAPSSRQLPR